MYVCTYLNPFLNGLTDFDYIGFMYGSDSRLDLVGLNQRGAQTLRARAFIDWIRFL